MKEDLVPGQAGAQGSQSTAPDVVGRRFLLHSDERPRMLGSIRADLRQLDLRQLDLRQLELRQAELAS
jgi:hypothetical protein